MLLRCYLYVIPLSMAKFVTAAFYGFIVLFLAIVSGWMWWLTPAVALLSVVLFYQAYYSRR
jgi:hypothetical protein